MKCITSALPRRYPNKTYSFMGTYTHNLAACHHEILERNVKRKRAMCTLYNMIISGTYDVENLVTLEKKFFCGHDIDSK